MNDTDVVYIIKEVEAQSKYVFKYGFELINKEKATIIVNDLYKIENINKPIKCESAYKVQDLIDICCKLGIELNNNDSKKKTKKEMYELIIQYF
jgi:F0F1-type ATP synthase epsilon subunit